MIYFGEVWEMPLAYAVPVQIRTPVGWPCEWCGALIQPGDRGYHLPLVTHSDDGPTIARNYIHRECYFAARLGHIVGICICTGALPSRVLAVLAWQRWEQVKDDQPW